MHNSRSQPVDPTQVAGLVLAGKDASVVFEAHESDNNPEESIYTIGLVDHYDDRLRPLGVLLGREEFDLLVATITSKPNHTTVGEVEFH